MKRERRRAVVSGGSVAFTALLLLFTLVFLATTFDLPASSAIVPRVVGVPLALLVSFVLVRETRTLLRQRAQAGHQPDAHERPRDDAVPRAAGAEPAARSAKSRAELTEILWLLALATLATILGFVVGPALYVFGWMRFRARERMVVAIVSAVLTAAAIPLLFSAALGVHLPHGVLTWFR
jgi:hypothetical protein